jgi:hypothetical protein
MIFAREISDPLTSLVKKIDAATAKHNDCSMGSFVVVLTSDEDEVQKKLKDLAKKEKIKDTVLTTDNPAGPRGYNIDKDADVTVVLYTKRNVKVNYAFKKGEMKAADVDKIVADVAKILPDKK